MDSVIYLFGSLDGGEEVGDNSRSESVIGGNSGFVNLSFEGAEFLEEVEFVSKSGDFSVEVSNLMCEVGNVVVGIDGLAVSLVSHSSVSLDSRSDDSSLFSEGSDILVESNFLVLSELDEGVSQVVQILKDLSEDTLVREILFSGEVEED